MGLEGSRGLENHWESGTRSIQRLESGREVRPEGFRDPARDWKKNGTRRVQRPREGLEGGGHQ